MTHDNSRNRRSHRLSTIWLIACLLISGLLALRVSAFGRHHSLQDETRPDRPQQQLTTRRIADIQLGDRVPGRNPNRDEVDSALPDPNPETWRNLKLSLTHEDGGRVRLELLRPLAWIEMHGAETGRDIFLELAEMGVIGRAQVLSISDCPAIPSGPGNVVTGKFIHESSGNLIDLKLAGQADPTGVTDNHLYSSEDRQDFVRAGDLQVNEQVQTHYGLAHVEFIAPRSHDELVYNLEVHREHVYRVGSLGTLVHNACPRVHGNSAESTNTNYGYVIFDKHTGKIHKYGITSSKIKPRADGDPFGKTERALSQVRKKNRAEGDRYDTITLRQFSNRRQALDWEKDVVGFFKLLRHKLSGNKLPIGNFWN